KWTANDVYRLREELKRVFAYFRLAKDWDGKARGGELACPQIDPDTGAVDSESPINLWRPGLRFERHLPLLTDHDYSGEITPEVADDTPEGSQHEFTPTLVWLKLKAGEMSGGEEPEEDESTAIFGQVDKLSGYWSSGVEATGDNATLPNVPSFSCS